MAVRKEIITDEWTAFTDAGQSGTCWLQKKPLRGHVVVSHSDAGTGALDDNISYPVVQAAPNILGIPADNSSDIYYAKCRESGAEAVIISDVI